MTPAPVQNKKIKKGKIKRKKGKKLEAERGCQLCLKKKGDRDTIVFLGETSRRTEKMDKEYDVHGARPLLAEFYKLETPLAKFEGIGHGVLM